MARLICEVCGTYSGTPHKEDCPLKYKEKKRSNLSKLWVPPEPPKPDKEPHMILTGSNALLAPEVDGYYPGRLRISKGKTEVRLRITMEEFNKLCEMGIEEWT